MHFNPKYGPGATISVDPDTLHGRRAIENAAIICHEANRGYCEAINDHSQVSWFDAPEWQRISALAGVERVVGNPDITPAELHGSWVEQKQKDGWVFGETKDAVAKTHPCMVPYDKLPEDQRVKDLIFRNASRAALYVYGLRFATPLEKTTKIDIGTDWRTSDPTLNAGMYIFTGRVSIVANQVLGELACALGGRVVKQSSQYRNSKLSQQTYAAMLSKDPDDAYGLMCANEWPVTMMPFRFSQPQVAHWCVLYRIVHAMMQIEGVDARKAFDNRWYYRNSGAPRAFAVEMQWDELEGAGQ